jgi:hypothetical protein
MGILDALIGNVLGSALGGNQRQDPLGSVLGGLAAETGLRAGTCCFKSRYCCCSKMAVWRESSAGSVKAA